MALRELQQGSFAQTFHYQRISFGGICLSIEIDVSLGIQGTHEFISPALRGHTGDEGTLFDVSEHEAAFAEVAKQSHVRAPGSVINADANSGCQLRIDWQVSDGLRRLMY